MSSRFWAFADSVSSDRLATLEAYCDFSEIVSLIVTEAEIKKCGWEPGIADRLIGLHRASFRLGVSRTTYDAFFNSPSGYRAQFARDPSIGLQCNRSIIDALQPTLRASWNVSTVPDSTIMQSLSGEDAKIWIDETEIEDQWQLEEPDILYTPWQESDDLGVGNLAPIGNHLEVKGGWVDKCGNVVRDPFKANRAREIHDHGYS